MNVEQLELLTISVVDQKVRNSAEAESFELLLIAVRLENLADLVNSEFIIIHFLQVRI